MYTLSRLRTLGVLPINVTMEQPSTRVVGSPSNSGTASRRNSHGVPSNRVDLLLIDRWVEGGVVRGVVHCLVDDLEFVAVQVERVETGIAGSITCNQPYALVHQALNVDLRVNKGQLNDIQMLDGDSVGHRTVDSLEGGILAHAEQGEQTRDLRHLVCTAGTRGFRSACGSRSV
jgi:hypothetical protein